MFVPWTSQRLNYPHSSEMIWHFDNRICDLVQQVNAIINLDNPWNWWPEEEIKWPILPDIDSLLKKYRKNNREKTPYLDCLYSLEIFKIEWRWSGFTYFTTPDNSVYVELYNDANYYLSLQYDWKIIWYIWFNINEDWNIFVVQLQWAKFIRQEWGEKVTIPHNNYLKSIQWRLLLVRGLEDFSKKSWFTWIIKIQSAEQNWWYSICGERNPWERWYNAYDQVAIDMWYYWNPNNNYSKTID